MDRITCNFFADIDRFGQEKGVQKFLPYINYTPVKITIFMDSHALS